MYYENIRRLVTKRNYFKGNSIAADREYDIILITEASLYAIIFFLEPNTKGNLMHVTLVILSLLHAGEQLNVLLGRKLL